ncbi:aldehyde dehydrogenase family protein [Burkholderia cepacia]|uniref:aldehyde dehydrogenase family protein n=1 Tax=Burkholderia cepacia TaxID=292 RepID=UPI002AB6E9A7|nr:aldehyde dehydrogenase family protein [Burkholderia cepacia]
MTYDLDSIFYSQKEYFLTDITRSYEWRIDQLNRLESMLLENQTAISDALALDFKTARFECSMEIYGTLGAIRHAKKELANWMRPTEAPLPHKFVETGHRATLQHEPYGVSLIIAPFNAPVILTLEPLIAALSAGNTAIVKPAQTTAALTALYDELFAKYFEIEAVALVVGDRELVTDLLALPFDFIFFTGSTPVGKIVMRAAAEHLTPVLLELGGQNPVLVDATANLEDAAEKIVWGAMAFGGQWCVSPGYVYVHESVADQFIDACKKAVLRLYGERPIESPDFSRIITAQDVDRIAGMLDGAPVVHGGQFDRELRYVAPTIVYPANWSDRIMSSEIFGPVLPVLKYKNLSDVIETVKRQPKSLAAYVFSTDDDVVRRFMSTPTFGGGAVNQTMIQCLLSSSLPFGGVGLSGLGRYYGKYGFESLSHLKSIVYSDAQTKVDALLPPYNATKERDLAVWFAEPEHH